MQAVSKGLVVGECEEQTVAEAQRLAEAQPVKDAEKEAAPLPVALRVADKEGVAMPLAVGQALAMALLLKCEDAEDE